MSGVYGLTGLQEIMITGSATGVVDRSSEGKMEKIMGGRYE